MNLFWFSVCLVANAAAHPDQYVVKIPLEATQLLYTAWHELEPSEKWRSYAPLTKSGTSRGYRATHKNHPLSRWVRRSTANYELCVDYALALCAEYTSRFSKTLDVERHLRWLKSNVPPRLRHRPRTPIPLCTGSSKKARTLEDAVKPYRKYYLREKTGMVRYWYRSPPDWVKPHLKLEQYERPEA